ncbi:MAG: type II secretion system protein [Rhodocyclales bacterium]|nr:type II secretion system protein [Rhodocyclales bacterium]
MNRRGHRYRQGNGERGFAYFALLIAIAFMGVGLAAAGEVWSLAQQREKEKQLLFVGGEFRRAIASYYQQDAGAVARYPRRLEDLLKDPRVPGVRRHLRRLYVDPITGASEWGLFKGRDGDIYGVYSLAQDAPVKRTGFAPDESQFEGKSKYSEWVFSPWQPTARSPGRTPAATAPARQSPLRH